MEYEIYLVKNEKKHVRMILNMSSEVYAKLGKPDAGDKVNIETVTSKPAPVTSQPVQQLAPSLSI